MNSVFAVNIDNFSQIFKEAMSEVNDIDKQAILKYRQKKDQYRKLVSTLLMQFFIRNLFALSDYELAFNSYGKPYLKDYTGMNFNISHSGRWVVGAVSSKPVGIDIEYIKEMDSYKDIAKRFFSSDEIKLLIEQPNEKSLQTFYEIWTKKESLIKAEGKGLSIPLDSFTVPLKTKGTLKYGNTIWHIFLSDFIDNNYKISLSTPLLNVSFGEVKYISTDKLLAETKNKI